MALIMAAASMRRRIECGAGQLAAVIGVWLVIAWHGGMYRRLAAK